MPETSGDVAKPDLDVKEFILPSAKTLVDRDVLAMSQQQHAKTKPGNLTMDNLKPGL